MNSIQAVGGSEGGPKGGQCLTVNGSQDDAGVVVGDDVGVAILGLIHLQVGVLPGELLAWVDRLDHTHTHTHRHTHTHTHKHTHMDTHKHTQIRGVDRVHKQHQFSQLKRSGRERENKQRNS